MRFNPRLPGGRRPDEYNALQDPADVSIHAFRGEGDPKNDEGLLGLITVSIHAFRGEGDRAAERRNTSQSRFQSTPSGGKATRAQMQLLAGQDPVSIHAFRGEGDWRRIRRSALGRCFNPRLPGGRRRCEALPGCFHLLFQSTPSGGKATSPMPAFRTDSTVSIHAFRGEGDVQ